MPLKFKAIVAGLKYPLEFVDGNLAIAEDDKIVVQQIISVIDTKFYERVRRPGYGTDYLVFRAGSEKLLMEADIEEAIKDFVKEVAEVTVNLSHDADNKWKLVIRYRDDARWYPALEYAPEWLNSELADKPELPPVFIPDEFDIFDEEM